MKKEREYVLWKGGYPSNEAENKMDELRKKRLQAELDALYAKRNNESELHRIDETIAEYIPGARGNLLR